ncbi:MAG: (d)CMP kinase [Salinivirgaceae bacterium]|nr:(d)CMP kinase [Salinivirgaceae bacterium]
MENKTKKLTIAIDGHSSCGKSTVAKSLAEELNYTYIDSGAMYRVVTLFCMENNLIKNDVVDEIKLQEELNNISIHFTYNKANKKYLTWLNGLLVEDKIRTIEVSNNVSVVSKIGFVRKKMVQLQQEMGKAGGIVMDGRDIGTVVFPNADLKIFMTASVNVRAERRFKELSEKGDCVSLKEVADNIEKRDYIDQNREISPLKKADDAFILDNSDLTREQQLTNIIELVNQKS